MGSEPMGRRFRMDVSGALFLVHVFLGELIAGRSLGDTDAANESVVAHGAGSSIHVIHHWALVANRGTVTHGLWA